MLGFFRENGTGYLVMQYLDGLSFMEYLQAEGRPIAYDEAVAIAMPVMDTLRVVHEGGLLHRDISPHNIYITKTRQVKLLDFGAARHALGDRSKSLSVILKAGYSPFEQYLSKGRQGPWTDIYAVAATIYRAITGDPPPEAPSRVADDELVRAAGARREHAAEAAERVLLQGDGGRSEGAVSDRRRVPAGAAPRHAEASQSPRAVIDDDAATTDDEREGRRWRRHAAEGSDSPAKPDPVPDAASDRRRRCGRRCERRSIASNRPARAIDDTVTRTTGLRLAPDTGAAARAAGLRWELVAGAARRVGRLLAAGHVRQHRPDDRRRERRADDAAGRRRADAVAAAMAVGGAAGLAGDTRGARRVVVRDLVDW